MDFNPRVKTKPGKLRPAVALQSDLVNQAGYPSTVVIPATTRLVEAAGILRQDSDLLVGQMIAVANESFREEIGVLPEDVMAELDRRIRIVLGL